METKKCPYCAEEIRVDARKCRFCNEYLDDALRSERLGNSAHGSTTLAASATAIAPKVAGVFCMECGRPMEESQTSCLACGTKVSLASAPAVQQVQDSPLPTQVQHGTNNPMIALIVVGIILLLIVMSRC